MATAEQYAQWIVANADKRGTPEFDTVAKAYQIAKGTPAAASTPKAAPSDPTSMGNLFGAAVEPNLALLSGAVAAPVAGLAGLATGVGRDLGMSSVDPANVVRQIQDKLTYTPRTTGGKNAMTAIGVPFQALAGAADYAGGKVNDLTGDPELAAQVNTVINALPGAIGLKSGGSSSVAGVADALSKRLMQSALKPSIKDLRTGAGDKAVQTLLDQGVNVTKGGAAALRDRVNTINDQIATTLEGSSGIVPKDAVLRRLDDTRARVQNQVSPQADLAAVDRVANDFANHPDLPTNSIPIQTAQDLKQGTYRNLSKKYGELGSADTEAQKNLARGLKEMIVQEEPSVGPLNAQESELLNALKMVERRTLVEGNKNPVGLGPLAHRPGNFAAFLADRSPLVKSLLARMLNPGSSVPGEGGMVASSAPSTFSQDQQQRQAIINALMRSAQ